MKKIFCTIEETASLLGVNKEAVKLFVDAGKLRPYRDGGRINFKREDVDQLIKGVVKHIPDDKIHITEIEFFGRSGKPTTGFVLKWAKKELGFGEITFALREDGHLHCDPENMSAEFIKEALIALLDNLVIDS